MFQICKRFSVLLVSISNFYLINAEAQKQLNKTEIFNYWVSSKGVLSLTQEEGLNKFLRFDSNLYNQIKGTLFNLQNLGIDKLGVFAYSKPGMITNDTCEKSIYPTEIYIFYEAQKRGYFKRVTNNCEYQPIRLDSVIIIFEYFEKNFFKIENEYIMPVTYGGEINTKGNFSYKGSTSPHEPQFIIFCKSKEKVKFLNFSSADYKTKESIFFADNLNSQSYVLFSKIVLLFGILIH
jgi:hypothetical protein